MTVSSIVREESYIGDGINSLFSFNIQANDPSWITGQVDGVTVAGSVDLNADQINNAGGTFTFSLIPADQSVVTILRTVPLTQELSLPDLTPFPARNVEDELDKLAMSLTQFIPSDNAVFNDVTVNGVYLISDGAATDFLAADGLYKTVVTGGGGVLGVQSGVNITVDNTTPELPIINLNNNININTIEGSGCEFDFIQGDRIVTLEFELVRDTESVAILPPLSLPSSYVVRYPNASPVAVDSIMATSPTGVSVFKTQSELRLPIRSSSAPSDITRRWENSIDETTYYYDGSHWVSEQEFDFLVNDDGGFNNGVYALFGATRMNAGRGIAIPKNIKLTHTSFSRADTNAGTLTYAVNGVDVDGANTGSSLFGDVTNNNQVLVGAGSYLTVRWIGANTSNMISQLWYRRYAV